MRLEVLVDQEDPLIFPLNKDRIIIGSGENSDIVLKTNGISRKHVIIDCGVDEYFVIDQGSTNGTFINEERLVPGKRVEFTSFFPVRLGTNILLTLLSDDEAADFELSTFNSKLTTIPVTNDDTTRVLKRPDLKESSSLSINTHRKKASVRAQNSLKSKTKGVPQNRAKKPKPEKNLNIAVLASIVVVIGAIYYQLTDVGPVDDLPQVTKANEIELKVDTPKLTETEEFKKMESEFIKPKEELNRILMDMKCISIIEKKLCDDLGLSAPYGVTQIGRDVFVFVSPQMSDDYSRRLAKVFPASKGHYPIELHSAYYLLNHTTKLSEEYMDYRIHLYFLDESQNELMGGVSFYHKGYQEFRRVASHSLLTDVTFGGFVLLTFADKYFVYHDFRSPPEEETDASSESL